MQGVGRSDGATELRRVMISNDDGIFANGLVALVTALQKTGKYDIRVVAPSTNQSAKSHSVTYVWGTYAQEYRFQEPEIAEVKAFHVDGTPADCAKLGLCCIYPDFRPHLVISGINEGSNLGDCVHLSGTIAAAREACMNGYSAIAVSLEKQRHPRKAFETACNPLLVIIERLFAAATGDQPLLPLGTYLSINIPFRKQGDYLGFRQTRPGSTSWGSRSQILPNKDPARSDWILFRVPGPNITMGSDDTDLSDDGTAMLKGYISISPLSAKHSMPADLSHILNPLVSSSSL
eukprot:TRINITY_DN20075_c0_g1_i1.p1 TRINITY_DN20075_c0_g1~~TRINITY_DN20075_c0_g1_i1.p1  ORF type:complete len:291 (+),score=62.79 TRINITY_DN20075_c0_g1_i1:48-920(+)